MWTGAVLVVGCILLSLGETITPEHNNCYSTMIVNKYAFYYKVNQSLTIEQCIAACNNRLTRYMGLQVDESFNLNNFVYCGNDLMEVSPQLNNSECSTCKASTTLNCGGNSSMSVYLLRESTPLAVLLQTNRGVELLIGNNTTLKVPYDNSSPYQSVDYIYTDSMIISFVSKYVLRSNYNSIGMQYNEPKEIRSHYTDSSSFAVDFITRSIFFGFKGNNALFRTNTDGIIPTNNFNFDYVPEDISIDPYNRSLIFVNYPYHCIETWLYFEQRLVNHTLNHLNIEKIKALSMDIQERLIYAIVHLLGDSSTYLVTLDYEVSKMHVLFNGSQLENATRLEVFRDYAIWLKNVGNTSTVFKCKLTPRCYLDNLTSYSSPQTIYDFTIYHPEKQTPGRKRLCANMTCSHGCELFTPFTARCSCPPGMEMNPDNLTCNNLEPSTGKITTQSTTSAFYEESSSDLVDLPTPDSGPSLYGVKPCKNDTVINSGVIFYEYLIVICTTIVLFLNIIIVIGIIILIKKPNREVNNSLRIQQPLELRNHCNVYNEIPLLD